MVDNESTTRWYKGCGDYNYRLLLIGVISNFKTKGTTLWKMMFSLKRVLRTGYVIIVTETSSFTSS